MLKTIAIAGAALVAATPALAQNVPANQATSVQKAKDPNRIICETKKPATASVAQRSARRRPSGTRCGTPIANEWKLATAADFNGQAGRLG